MAQKEGSHHSWELSHVSLELVPGIPSAFRFCPNCVSLEPQRASVCITAFFFV